MPQKKSLLENFKTAIMCSTYDDEIWSLVDMGLSFGDEETKKLASELKGMNVDEAQAYLRQHP